MNYAFQSYWPVDEGDGEYAFAPYSPYSPHSPNDDIWNNGSWNGYPYQARVGVDLPWPLSSAQSYAEQLGHAIGQHAQSFSKGLQPYVPKFGDVGQGLSKSVSDAAANLSLLGEASTKVST